MEPCISGTEAKASVRTPRVLLIRIGFVHEFRGAMYGLYRQVRMSGPGINVTGTLILASQDPVPL